jgi:hypothetical protein
MRFYLFIFLLLIICICLLFLSEQERYVAYPLISCFLILGWLFNVLIKKDVGFPLFDIGFFCAFITFLYSTIPLVNFSALGMKFSGIINDSRLMSYNLTPEEMGSFHWRHVVYLSALSVSYFWFRNTAFIPTGGVQEPSPLTKNALIVMWLSWGLFFLSLQIYSDSPLSGSYESNEFSANYYAMSSLPLVVRQLAGKAAMLILISKLAVLFVLVQKFKDSILHKYIFFIWLIIEVALAVVVKGSRSSLAFFVCGFVFMYHRLVARLSPTLLVSSGLIFLIVFTLLGIVRNQMGAETMSYSFSGLGLALLTSGNEFQSLLGTAYDVYRRTLQGLDVPSSLYLNDIVTILPPSQIMPFEKISGSDWYLHLIGKDDLGVGFMWGVVPQSIIGLDWIELALRGFVLGFILAKIHAWYVKRKNCFLETFIYIYLCLRVYQTFRDTTGALLGVIVWEVLPFLFVLWAITGFSRATNPKNMLRGSFDGQGFSKTKVRAHGISAGIGN